MSKLRREVGFLSAVGNLHLKDLLSPEFAGGAILGIGGSILYVQNSTAAARSALAGDFLQITPTLLGIVFAAMALVVALMSKDYMRELAGVTGGLLGFLRPFVVAIGLQVTAVLLAVGYRAFYSVLPGSVEPWIFGAAVTLFVVSLLDVLALTRAVVMHGLARGRLEAVTDISTRRDRGAKSS